MMNNTTNTDAAFDSAKHLVFDSEWKRTNHYAFLTGQLQGLLRYWINSGVVPGVNITDRAAYDTWVEQAIAEAKASAEKHSAL